MSQIHDLFLDAHELPSPEERRAFLDRECADRPDLRREVEALLAAADQADAWFGEENGGVEDGGGRERPDFRLETARAEDRIGRYRLLEQIGEGGFGVVWKAEQEYPVRRSVAVKIIKAGMDTREVVARFEQERQALAMMNHPHIAQVLEAGATESGRPYFAMELVSGVPVTEFCDERHLTVEERLALFREICLAIQHAHRKGIIHRDIKPSNILTAMVDGRPAPKVIDFGIAKATQQPLTDATLLTSFEQFIGTPEYMSPEQAAGGMTNIDTRSDIYSLGVLLYELLTGGPPFARKTLAGAGHQEIRRIICEEEAPKPSARLGAIREEEGARVAAARRTEPDRLRRRVRGDLDWIVMRALEKDRDRRYESASDLAMDVHSFLEHRPVKAGPPSAGYVLRKFARRHRVAITASVSVAAALVAGLTVSLWMFLHEKAARERAVAAELTAARRLAESETARREARTVSGFLLDLLRSPYPADKGPPVTIRQVLDKAGKDLPTVFRDMPEDRAVMEEALAMSYDTIGSSGMAIPLLASASEYVRRHPSHGPESELSRRLQARLALLHSRAGKPHLAIPRMEACLKWEQRLDSGSLEHFN